MMISDSVIKGNVTNNTLNFAAEADLSNFAA